MVGESTVRARVNDDDQIRGMLPRVGEERLRWASYRLDGIMLDRDASGAPGLLAVAMSTRPDWRPRISPGALEMIERSYVSLFVRTQARDEVVCLLTGAPVNFPGASANMVPAGDSVWEVRVTAGHDVVHGLRPGLAYPSEVAGWLDELRVPGWSVKRQEHLRALQRARRAWVRHGRRGSMANPFQPPG